MKKSGREDYLDYVCGGIVSKRVRADVRDELADHIDQMIERNIATGMNEDDAESSAIADMGSKETLRVRMSKLHSKSDITRMRGSLYTLIFGLAMLFISIGFNDTPHIYTILGTLSLPLLISALYRMRKVNRLLTTAFYSFVIYAVISTVQSCMQRCLDPLPLIQQPLSVIRAIPIAVFCVTLLMGLQLMYRKYDSKNVKYNGLTLSAICFVFLIAAITVEMRSAVNSFENAYWVALSMFLYGAVSIYTIWQLLRLKSMLWDADEQYGIEGFTKRHNVIAAVAAVLVIAAPLYAMYKGAVPQKNEIEFMQSKASETALPLDYSAIRAKLVELGIPQDVVDDLPDDEISEYENAVKLSTEKHKADEHCSLDYSAYLIFTDKPDTKSSPANARLLWVAEPTEYGYCDGVYLRFSNILTFGRADNPCPFAQALYTSNGKRLCGKITNIDGVFTKYDKWSEDSVFEFYIPKDAENGRVIFAQNMFVKTTENAFYPIDGKYVHRNTWLDYSRADMTGFLIRRNFSDSLMEFSTGEEKLGNDTGTLFLRLYSPYDE